MKKSLLLTLVALHVTATHINGAAGLLRTAGMPTLRTLALLPSTGLTATPLYQQQYISSSSMPKIDDQRSIKCKIGDFCRDVLIGIGQCEKPNLKVARTFLFVSTFVNTGKAADARDRGDIWQDNPGATALTTAASNGKTEYVELLLDHGAFIEQKSPWNGFTALMNAALYDSSLDTLKLLIRRGANINAQTGTSKTTALMLAAEEGNIEIVRALLAAGADITLENDKGKTALMLAERKLWFGRQDNYDLIIALLKEHATYDTIALDEPVDRVEINE